MSCILKWRLVTFHMKAALRHYKPHQLSPVRYFKFSCSPSVGLKQQKETTKKKKWNKENIQTLTAWKHETMLIFGPPLKVKKQASSLKPRKSKSTKTDHGDQSNGQITSTKSDVAVETITMTNDAETVMSEMPDAECDTEVPPGIIEHLGYPQAEINFDNGMRNEVHIPSHGDLIYRIGHDDLLSLWSVPDESVNRYADLSVASLDKSPEVTSKNVLSNSRFNKSFTRSGLIAPSDVTTETISEIDNKPSVSGCIKIDGHTVKNVGNVRHTKPAGHKFKSVERSSGENDSSVVDIERRCHYEWVDVPPATHVQNIHNVSGTEDHCSYPCSTESDLKSDHCTSNLNCSHSDNKNTKDSQLYQHKNLLETSSKSHLSEQPLHLVHSDSKIPSHSQTCATVKNMKDEQITTAVNSFILNFPLFVPSHLHIATQDTTAVRFPSVSSILRTTMSPESQLALQRWEKQMIAQLGDEGFRCYKETLFANGSNLHLNIQQYLAGTSEEINILPANEGHWQSIEPVLGDITDVIGLEKPVRHKFLHYCGVMDCVAEYRGERCIIEWKTAKRRKTNIKYTYDNPLQLVAYLGAFNSEPATLLQVERCLLVIGYDDGAAADIHVMDKWDCMKYWQLWLKRLNLFHTTTQQLESFSICSKDGQLPRPVSALIDN